MVSLIKNFSLTLTLLLAALTILPGAADVDAKCLSRSTKHHHHHHHKHKHHLKHHHHKHHLHPQHHNHHHQQAHKSSKHHHKGKHRHHRHHPHSNHTNTGTGSKLTDDLIPYGLKAGITGEDGLEQLHPYIGSYSNWKPQPWSPVPPEQVLFMPMLWGAGHATAHDGELLSTFRSLFGTSGSRRSSPPKVVIGFEEPDCPPGHGSAGTPVNVAAHAWNTLIGPLKQEGTVLVSPSMCKQTDEDYLTPFEDSISVKWDVTNVHVNQDNVDDVKREIDYYWTKYKKPIYVTEFACVSTNPWRPVTDQGLINNYIRDVVDYFESDDRVKVYQYSTGEGLSDQWRLTVQGTKTLTESGRVYKSAIMKYAGGKASRVGVSRRGVDPMERAVDAQEDDDDDDADADLDDDVDVTFEGVADDEGEVAKSGDDLL